MELTEIIEKLEAIYAVEGNVDVKTFDLDRHFCSVEEVELMNFNEEKFVYIG